jgi:sulfonate transport system substrate-binding protein
VNANAPVIKTLFEVLVEQGTWLKQNAKQAAALIAPLQGLDVDVVEVNLRRYHYGVAPLTDAVIAEQQKIADTFFDLKLISKRISVRDAAWKAA